jgi:multiple antibiotic resistance protein
MDISSTIITIFVTFNAIGNIPVFIGMLRAFNIPHQRRIIFREMLFALALMLLFSYFGKQVLQALSLDLFSLRIAGGMILFMIALNMLFPRKADDAVFQHEPFIVPLATPLMTGPGTISTIMIFSDQMQNDWMMLFAIVAAWVPSLILLLLSAFIKNLVGEPVLHALEKIAGMILAFIAIQMFSVGIGDYARSIAQMVS